MRKWMRRIVVILLLAVFVFSAGRIAVVQNQYRTDEKFYAVAAEQYMRAKQDENNGINVVGGVGSEEETAPIDVDFESLQQINKDIIGWIYCEDTVINYPILKGENNNTYVHHTYEGNYSAAGSIFMDAQNQPDFADANTIIYGHHMKDGSMFAALQEWMDQDFYEKHPIMWLLTPKQDYKIVLFSGYTTSAYSDTYTIFTGPCEELNNYLKKCAKQSMFQTDVELNENGYYILLSTCAYRFENARYVLHGMLVSMNTLKEKG